ncbi:MAG: ParB N-terminal domain-containing protein [Anaerolineae bacterium]
MSKLEEVPVLRIVLVKNLVLHEETDPRRVEGLMHRIREDGLLKNPPVVAPMSEAGHYVVLDGANRAAALAGLGIRDAVVQVVDYDTVQVDTWNHLVAGVGDEALFEAIRSIPDIDMRGADLETARRLWRERAVLAYVVGRDGDVYIIEAGENLQQSAQLLNRMADVYRGEAMIYRVQTDDTGEMLSYYDDVAATIIYPPFQPADILNLASNSAKLPTGITRHIIPRRALRVNIRLELLAEDRPLTEKNAWLETWLRRKLQNKEVRYYEEATFLFDE